MARSMTGFARAEQSFDFGNLSCEIRSVNHRYLEINLRLPESLRSLDQELRGRLKKELSRGKVEASLFFKIENQQSETLSLNEAHADQVVSLAQKIAAKLAAPAPINPLDILQWPGVLHATPLDSELLATRTLDMFDMALEKLVENRAREGAELQVFVQQRLDDTAAIVQQLNACLPELLEANQQKLREKITALNVDIDQERLSQELVYIAQKSDVAEELDRLRAHINEVSLTLNKTEPMGRRLDFLMQELNREANTLASKSTAHEATQHAVNLKVLIEQMREQIQNIE